MKGNLLPKNVSTKFPMEFLVTTLAFRQRMHSWNVFTLTVVLLWEHQIQKKNHSPNWSSKKSAKSMDKQSRQPIRKVRPERIEFRGIKSWFALWHSKSLNSTPSMMLSLMVLKTVFQITQRPGTPVLDNI